MSWGTGLPLDPHLYPQLQQPPSRHHFSTHSQGQAGSCGQEQRSRERDGRNIAVESSVTQDVEVQYISISAEKKMLGAFCSLQGLSLPWMNDAYLPTFRAQGQLGIFFLPLSQETTMAQMLSGIPFQFLPHSSVFSSHSGFEFLFQWCNTDSIEVRSSEVFHFSSLSFQSNSLLNSSSRNTKETPVLLKLILFFLF